MIRFVPILLTALALAGCARDTGDFPSLAPRPAEKLGFEEPAQPAPEPMRADPALDRQIAEQRAALDKAKAAFDGAADRAGRLGAAAKGAAVGSERWLSAQAALAGLDTLRADTTQIVTALDDLASARAAKLVAPYPALDAARDAASEAAEAQAARIDALARLLPTA